MDVSKSQLAALRAVCDGILPSIDVEDNDFYQKKASDLEVAEAVLALAERLGPQQKADFRMLLSLLASPFLGLTWLGPLKSAQNLSLTEIEKMLQTWSKSPVGQLRFAFASLKKLAGLAFLTVSKNGEPSPVWPTLGYDGPPARHADFAAKSAGLYPKTAKMPENGQLRCQVLIIGSGAGGGVAAAVLAEKGFETVVVEKGPGLAPDQISQREGDGLREFYESGGLLTSDDGSVSLLAGAVLGGGTTVNWAASFRTPDFVLDEWARAHQNPDFLSQEFLSGFDFLEKKMAVRPAEPHNPQNASLFAAAQKLGYKVSTISVNQAPLGSPFSSETAQKTLGFSPFGDVFGQKQGTARTFLNDAEKAGAKIFTRVFIEKIVTRNGAAVGAEGFFENEKGEKRPVSIAAERVVVAAGAIWTPVLLRKSGLRHPEIGQNLKLHPTVAVPGWYFLEPSESWHGHMMSAVCDEFTRIDGDFGVKIETPPLHPGLFAVGMNWPSAKSYRDDLVLMRFARTFIGITRDRDGGSVKVGPSGWPKIDYWLSEFDRKNMVRGVREMARLHAAAGADRVQIWHHDGPTFEPKNGDLPAFLDKIERLRWQKHRFQLFTAHQMGTARMGGDARKSPVLPTGETREIKNLWVADASLFPSASGSNPMLSVMNLALFVAKNVR